MKLEQKSIHNLNSSKKIEKLVESKANKDTIFEIRDEIREFVTKTPDSS